MPKVTMSLKDLERAALDSVWYPRCPNCGEQTPAEPDAEFVYCLHCDHRIEIENPFY